jgi:DNA polymerase delta subunit 1
VWLCAVATAAPLLLPSTDLSNDTRTHTRLFSLTQPTHPPRTHTTQALGKSADESGYAAKQAHVELAMRMKKRDPGTAPNVGDRVAYVIIQAGKGAPAYERSEDPVYVLENNLPIDTDYYLQNQLSNPLTRLFEPIIDNPETLLTGDHTRTIAKPTPMGKGITMFAVKKLKCMGCKTPIASNGGGSLCAHCKPREAEIYTAKALEVRGLVCVLW